jgi:hypothetical protein
VDRRFRWLASLAFVAGVLSPSLALSAPKDAAATKLADDAINNDYLATNFAAAEKKLKSAIALCGANACSAQTRARLHRDLGVVYVAGMSRADDGTKEFVEALKADPNVALEKDLTTPEVEKAFQAAKGGGPAAAPAPAAKGPPAAGGDMVHTPAPEQTVLTPVPVYVELAEGVEAVKVIARYKAFGATDWKTIELRKIGNGFGAEIPCQEVGSATGDLSYYVQATDGAGDVVSTSGSRNAPNKVAIKNEISGEAPHLPGKPASAQCRDKADCPPGFPGCTPGKKKSATGNKSWGDACQKDIECGEGLACKGGQCETGEKQDGSQLDVERTCEMNSDCNEGETCGADKVCETPGAGRKLWISASVQPDLSIVTSQNNVCGSVEVVQASNVKCIGENGSDYNGIPDEGFVGERRGNAIKGGLHVPTVRILVGLDYLVLGNLSVGARLGYSLGGVAPGRSISALHAEARVTYWIGKNPFKKTAVRPYAALIGGLAEVDDKFDVQVHECTSAACIRTKPNEAFPPSQTLTVWRKAGGAFAGLAAGAMIPIGPKQGVMAEVKVQRLLPNAGVVISPSVGYAFGF